MSATRNLLFVTALASVSLVAAHAEIKEIAATAPEISAWGYMARAEGLAPSVLGFDRKLELPTKGFRWDNPGTRVAWRTDSPTVRARIIYTPQHIAPARNSVGAFRVDGQSDPAWHFNRPTGPFDTPAETFVTVPVPSSGFHTYELILPYGDSVQIAGIEVDTQARFESVSKPPVRYVAFGDSITHGFTASAADRSYAFLTADAMGWELVNVGFGGRSCRSTDADILIPLNPQRLTVLIGVNDWQGGAEPQKYRDNLTAFLGKIRQAYPQLPITVITPLWVPPTWKPSKARFPLEDYRQVAREVVATLPGPASIVEGPDLIDHDATLFDKVAVHPNDAGFAQMAQRLAAALRTHETSER